MFVVNSSERFCPPSNTVLLALRHFCKEKRILVRALASNFISMKDNTSLIAFCFSGKWPEKNTYTLPQSVTYYCFHCPTLLLWSVCCYVWSWSSEVRVKRTSMFPGKNVRSYPMKLGVTCIILSMMYAAYMHHTPPRNIFLYKDNL